MALVRTLLLLVSVVGLMVLPVPAALADVTPTTPAVSTVPTQSPVARKLYEQGKQKYNQGDYQGSEQDFSQALEVEPRNIPAYNGRGKARLALKDLQGALQDYNKVVEIAPERASGYYNRGITRFGLQDYSGAIADFDQVIRIMPDAASGYYQRGSVQTTVGDTQAAIADYGKAADLYRQEGREAEADFLAMVIKSLQ